MSAKKKPVERPRSRRSSAATYGLAALLVVTLGVSSGLAHGLLDGRWLIQPNLQAIGGQLDRLPAKLGDWVLLQDDELPASALEMLRCYGHTYRTYQNTNTGSRVSVAVLFGPRGPIAVHTPELCYSSQGVSQSQERYAVKVDTEDQSHTLWKVDFMSALSAEPEFSVYYAWSDGGPWQASKQPRFWLTDRLYKIQLSVPPDKPGRPAESKDFLQHLLPALAPLMQQNSTAH